MKLIDFVWHLIVRHFELRIKIVRKTFLSRKSHKFHYRQVVSDFLQSAKLENVE